MSATELLQWSPYLNLCSMLWGINPNAQKTRPRDQSLCSKYWLEGSIPHWNRGSVGICAEWAIQQKLWPDIWWWWWVAHHFLVTAQRPNSPFFPFLGLTFRDLGIGLWTGTWPWACQFQHTITMRIHYTPSSWESRDNVTSFQFLLLSLIFITSSKLQFI